VRFARRNGLFKLGVILAELGVMQGDQKIFLGEMRECSLPGSSPTVRLRVPHSVVVDASRQGDDVRLPISSPSSPAGLAVITAWTSGRSLNIGAWGLASQATSQERFPSGGVEPGGASQSPLRLQLFAPSSQSVELCMRCLPSMVPQAN
jgi:hypothetical protein